MNWTDVKRNDLNTAICYIQNNYDPSITWKIIGYFHERMSQGEPYDQDMLHVFMAHVFERMVNGEITKKGTRIRLTADQAFGLTMRKGQGNIKGTLDRDLKATACMILLMRDGVLWQDAKGYAANLLFPDDEGEKAVERAYESHRVLLEMLDRDTLLATLAPYSLPS
ncbi:hypothetical protein [Stutzerimonas stutzeri]|uniref:Uncharacterized protein n=1 Tax=Stutzerimonas stutzeri TaxID=316 RepID=A0A5S5BE98_STUST|nr:hypothetical protein [Stutzerimonas stutzeri]TYP65371.1 hypothetical protein A9A72_122499 [Stutzerimonas stutzeri]